MRPGPALDRRSSALAQHVVSRQAAPVLRASRGNRTVAPAGARTETKPTQRRGTWAGLDTWDPVHQTVLLLASLLLPPERAGFRVWGYGGRDAAETHRAYFQLASQDKRTAMFMKHLLRAREGRGCAPFPHCLSLDVEGIQERNAQVCQNAPKTREGLSETDGVQPGHSLHSRRFCVVGELGGGRYRE